MNNMISSNSNFRNNNITCRSKIWQHKNITIEVGDYIGVKPDFNLNHNGIFTKSVNVSDFTSSYSRLSDYAKRQEFSGYKPDVLPGLQIPSEENKNIKMEISSGDTNNIISQNAGEISPEEFDKCLMFDITSPPVENTNNTASLNTKKISPAVFDESLMFDMEILNSITKSDNTVSQVAGKISPEIFDASLMGNVEIKEEPKTYYLPWQISK